MEYTRVGPGLPPVHGARAGALILGSFPSPKSREQGFFYGHPQNRFWPLLAALTGAPAPAHGDIAAKKAPHHRQRPRPLGRHPLLLHPRRVGRFHPGCRTKRDPELIAALGVQAVFCNGAAAARLYARYIQPAAGLAAVRLPSTSRPTRPARRCAAPRWGAALAPWLARRGKF